MGPLVPRPTITVAPELALVLQRLEDELPVGPLPADGGVDVDARDGRLERVLVVEHDRVADGSHPAGVEPGAHRAGGRRVVVVGAVDERCRRASGGWPRQGDVPARTSPRSRSTRNVATAASTATSSDHGRDDDHVPVGRRASRRRWSRVHGGPSGPSFRRCRGQRFVAPDSSGQFGALRPQTHTDRLARRSPGGPRPRTRGGDPWPYPPSTAWIRMSHSTHSVGLTWTIRNVLSRLLPMAWRPRGWETAPET